jgi:predicted enzyme related to lactoylglutathione lyase
MQTETQGGGMMNRRRWCRSTGASISIVEGIDAAAKRHRQWRQNPDGPMEVPGGQWVVNCIDPARYFGLLSNTK